MNWNKYFRLVCIVCMLAVFNGCGSSTYAEPPQNTPAADISPTAADETATDKTSGNDTQASAADAGNSYIAIDEVKSIVLENAGFAEENVRFVRLKLVSENGSGQYDVEFVSDTAEYDYMVDAMTGEILSMNCEMGNYDIDNIPSDVAQADLPQSGSPQGSEQPEENTQSGSSQGSGQPEMNTQSESPQGSEQPEINTQSGNAQGLGQPEMNMQAGNQQTGNSQNEGVQNSNGQNGADNYYIGREAAQQAALAHAGLDANAVRFAHTHLDFDDGRWMYDVEFHKGNEEYDYDIDAVTGEVLSYDYDAEYINSGAAATQGSEYITQEKAKQIALAHAGVAESDAQYLKVEFDYDDGRAEYEVEWDVGRMEYSCDVNAYTGEILSFDKELD